MSCPPVPTCRDKQLPSSCGWPARISREELNRALKELIGVGLVSVVRGAGRETVYTCSPAVQRYAIAEADGGLIEQFGANLSSFYVHQFAAEPENARWAVPHIAGIRAVLQQLSDHGDDERLQALFSSTLDILFTLGLFDDRVITGRLAYESAMRVGNYRAASLATDVISSTHAARGDLDRAREAVALGLVAAEHSADPGERARQLRAHGLVLYKSGDAAGALEATGGAEDLAGQTGDVEVIVNVLGLRTVAYWYLGEMDASASVAEHGLRVCEEISWRRATAYPLRNLAEVAIHFGRFDQARTLLADAARVAAAFDDHRQMARVELTAARLALLTGEPRVAGERASAAIAQAQSLGLGPELRELEALSSAAAKARLLPPLRFYYARRRPSRFTDAAVGGD